MKLSKVKLTAAAVLALAFAASAQFSTPFNARTAALGGAPLADITNIYNYPALMMGYLDQAQVTWSGGVGGPGTEFGTFIFTKSITDMFALGLVANHEGLVHRYFSSAALGALPGLDAPALPNIPHLLLGFDFGTFWLGADMFFDHNGLSGKETIDDFGTVNSSASATNWGARLSADIHLGDLELLGKLGFGFPSLTAEYKDPDTSITWETNKGLYMELGAEAAYPLAGLDLTLGLEYTFVNHQMKSRPVAFGGLGPDEIPDEVRNSMFKLYFACEANLLETAAAVAAYQFTRLAETTVETQVMPDAPNRKVTGMDGTHHHTFYAGLENTWDKMWKFDGFQLRTGLSYEIALGVGNEKNNYNGNKEEGSGPATHTFASPMVGIGLTKGPVTLDMAVNFGRLFDNYDAEEGESDIDFTQDRGLLAGGPTIAVATLTVKF